MPPKVLEELETSSAPEVSGVSILAGDGSGTDSLLGIQAARQVSVSAVRSKPRKFSKILALFISAVFMFGPLFVTWFAIGDKLGLPDMWETLGVVQGAPGKTVPLEGEDGTVAKTVPIEGEDGTVADAPKLLSPSVEIVGGQFLVDQVLDQQTSKPVGSKTIVDVQVRNLTRCDIVNMAFKLNCIKSGGEAATFEINQVNFSRGLMPEASGVLSLTCEPGVWEKVEVSIVSVESENESELTVIGPHVIQNGDKLVGE